MPFRTVVIFLSFCAVMLLLSSVIANASDLHPLGKPIPDGLLSFELRDLGHSRDAVVVESTYKPYRERDVRKQSSLHLFDSLWRSGSRDTLKVKREETYTVSQAVRVTKSSATFTIPLHATEPEYKAYQLARVRVGELVFERWFAEPPDLVPDFGLQCSATMLQGKVRFKGLTAAPLNGGLPLWPTLRQVQLSVAPVAQPDVNLWDPQSKKHWDGWRKTTPQQWPGGQTVVARHIDGMTVWRAHEYFAYAPAGAPIPAKPAPPTGALPGIALEIFWPKGDKLEFPDAFFERPAAVLGLRVSRLTPRVRDLLASSIQLRPGVEQHSVTAAEWAELEELVEEAVTEPVEFSIKKAPDGKESLVAYRRKLTEPWLYLFGIEYDADRRFSMSAIVLYPKPWNGPLPE